MSVAFGAAALRSAWPLWGGARPGSDVRERRLQSSIVALNSVDNPGMPTLQTVEQFVQLVEAGQGVAALDEFYAENASVQENQSAPRIGKQALLAHETAAQASVSNMTARCVRPILIEGDTVVLRWTFDYVDGRGQSVQFEELAYQRWAGERIREEQFFYDPAQFKLRA